MTNYIFKKTNLSISFPESAVLDKNIKNIFKFEENRRIYRAKNPNKREAIKLKIDGKLYSKNTKKCDYGLLLEDSRFFLIELKGRQVEHACKQILTTLKLLKRDYKRYKFSFLCRIVAKRGCPATSTYKQNLINEIGISNFLSRENVLEEDI